MKEHSSCQSWLSELILNPYTYSKSTILSAFTPHHLYGTVLFLNTVIAVNDPVGVAQWKYEPENIHVYM